MRPDGSIVIATGNDDALGVYTCTPYNSYGTAGESQPTRVLLKVRLGRWAHCPSPLPKLLPPCCVEQRGCAPCLLTCPAAGLHPVPSAAKPRTVHACLPGPPCLHSAPQGGILPGGGPGAGDPLCGPRGSPPNCHLAEGRSCQSGEPAEPSSGADAAFGLWGITLGQSPCLCPRRCCRITSLLVPAGEGAQGTLLVLPSKKPGQNPAPQFLN